MFGFAGFSSMSDAPVLSEILRTWRQDLPPSVVLKIPRSAFGLNASPTADSQTVFGSFGWMRTAPIWPELYRPLNDHVCPASVDLYTPRPVDTLLRMSSEPVPR